MEEFLQLIPIFVVFGLIISFFISLAHLVKRSLINSTTRTNNANEIGKKIDMLIEQNEKLISLLKKNK